MKKITRTKISIFQNTFLVKQNNAVVKEEEA